jgi:hypothetical protein
MSVAHGAKILTPLLRGNAVVTIEQIRKYVVIGLAVIEVSEPPELLGPATKVPTIMRR